MRIRSSVIATNASCVEFVGIVFDVDEEDSGEDALARSERRKRTTLGV
jgi:hypothetical protein